jgi:zinc transport system ATP-binding protein
MITAQNLGLQLDGNVILDDVSFSVAKGEYVGLIGPNGAGKTSLIKVILGFYKQTTGSIKIDSNIKVGYVPQQHDLSGVVPISVEEVLKMSGLEDKKSLFQHLKKVGLSEEFLERNFHKLSGGQKQRIIIARALCLEPELLIFDEPLTGVDYETKRSLYQLLFDLNKKEKLTILFVSHEVDQIVSECHHILCLNKTMHTGCHPLDFAKGKITDCPILENVSRAVPIHHHHNHSKCSC